MNTNYENKLAFHNSPQTNNITPDIPQSEIAATNFFDRAKFSAKNWAKNGAKFWTKISGHFRASCAVQNDPPKFLPKFLPIYHPMSCHGSCGRHLKISSPRASWAWGAQTININNLRSVTGTGRGPNCMCGPFSWGKSQEVSEYGFVYGSKR